MARNSTLIFAGGHNGTQDLGNLRTVARFVTAHMICASRNSTRNSGFLWTVPTNTKIFLCRL